MHNELNMAEGATVAEKPTSPASCLKTWRNCLSSSLSCCSAYTAGLHGGSYNMVEKSQSEQSSRGQAMAHNRNQHSQDQMEKTGMRQCRCMGRGGGGPKKN